METMVRSDAMEALAHVSHVLDALAGADLTPADVTEALELIRATERAARQLRSVQIGLVQPIEEAGLHRPDGHASARVMVGHAAGLSDPEAKRRAKAARALEDLPEVAAGLADGGIGVCHVDRIARTHANPRVRERFIELDAEVAGVARRCSYRDLDHLLTNWERQADEDGTADRSSRNHENRDARIVDDYDGGWRILGGCGSLDGVELHAILVAFTEAELAADWAEARTIHGEAATFAQLPRTDNQRRFDALLRVFRLAADQHAAAPGGSSIDTDIVIDHETLERQMARLAGRPPAPRTDLHLDPDHDLRHGRDHADDEDPADTQRIPVGPQDEEHDGAARSGTGYRCSTIDGVPVDPTEATLNALLGRVRRVVVGSDSVVIDLGRRSRIFTGPAQLAVALSATHCYWPGCSAPTTRSQADHLRGWRSGGRTSPDNGAPLCGRHNRHKEHGYTVTRDRRGRLWVLKPDGSRLE